MNGVWRVARREYRAYLATPWCYGVAVAFLALTGITFFVVADGAREASLRLWFPNLAFVASVTMPVVTSRTVAEEKRMRHLDVLLARPVGTGAVVVGKWLAVVGLFLTFLAPTVGYLAFLAAWGQPDWPPILTSYLGAVALAGLFAAVGTLMSVFTATPILAGLASFAALVTLQLGADVPVLRSLSYVDRFDSFSRGAPRLADAVYFLTATAVCLGIATAWQTIRRTSIRLRRMIAPATGLAVLATANLAVLPVDKVFDVTASGRFTLSRASREALANHHGTIKITAFEPADSAAAKDDTVLFKQLRDVKPSVQYRVLDLDRAQGEALRLGVDNYGQAAVEVGSRREVVSPVTELSVVSALERLARRRPQTVCALTGHGERSLEDTAPRGYASTKAAIGINGASTREIDLTVDQTIPPECTIMALLDPKTPLRPVEVDALGRFLEHDGKMLVTVEPGGPDLLPLTAPWGLRVLPGTVFDPARSVAGDPTALLVNRFPAESPVTRDVAGAAVVTAGGVTTAASAAHGLVVSPVFASSGSSWLDLDPAAQRNEPEKGDRQGPVVIGGAADRSEISESGEQRIASGGPKIDRTRLLVIADADWASNAYLGELANQTLLANSLNWLAGEEDLVAIRGLQTDLRRLALTPPRRQLMGVVTVAGVPLTALTVGIGLWYRRRRR
jgi:gliding motility-associatede transport system auxiliary component